MITAQTNTRKYAGTDLLIDSLLCEKTEVVFGSIAGMEQCTDKPFDLTQRMNQVILQHEQSTIHAADGYARATGNVGVAFLPTGSALTNAITGILNAQMDSVPLVIIALRNDDKNLEAEFDLFGLTTPVTKYYLRIDSALEIHSTIKEAFQIAREGRPGTVVVELAKAALNQYGDYPFSKAGSNENDKKCIPEKMLLLVKQEVIAAKRPVLLIGGGVVSAEASHLVRRFTELTQIPVVSTLMGLGAFPANHPLFLGMVGMHGTFAANKAVHRADLLICLGIRFSDRVTGKMSGFSPKSRKIQVDIDAAEINKNVLVDLPIVGDVYSVLSQLIEVITPGDTSEWIAETSKWQKISPRFSQSNSELKPQQVIQLFDRFSSEEAIVATDVGQHQIWTALNYQFKHPRTFITSGGLGTMGFGLPAAIGAAIANKGKEVMCISGDGSFQMNYQELAAVAKYQLLIKIAILKNGYLGMVRQWQELFYQGRYSSVKISSPNFVTLAAAYGIQVGSAKNLTEAQDVIEQAFKHNGPVLMEFDVTVEENVFPMVPPGSSNNQTRLN